MREHELALSGVVDSGQAVKVGKLLNARVLVPGMVRVGDRVRRTRQAPDMTSAIVASRSSST